MPSIFGICSSRPSEKTEALGRRLLLAMRRHEGETSCLHVDALGRAALGRVQRRPLDERSAVQVNESGLAVQLDGEIYGSALLRRQLEQDGVRVASADQATLLGQAFLRWGHQAFTRIEGYFNAALWQPATGIMAIVNDRFGMKPLYYVMFDGGFAFASEIKALLQVPGVTRTLSLRGVAQFFTFGHFLGDDTMFEDVRASSPATVTTYDTERGVMTSDRYWQLTQGPVITDKREAFAALNESFGRGVDRRLEGLSEIGLSLSGGLDARTILAAIPAKSVHVKSMSLGIRGSIDHRVASRLAAIAGVEHHHEFLENNFVEQFPRHLRRLVFLTDGHHLDEAVTVPTLPVFRKVGIRTLLRGHAGELLHMDKAYAFSIRRDELGFTETRAVEAWLWSHLSAYMVEGIGHSLFRPDLRDQVAALARQSLAEALDRSRSFAPHGQRLWHLFVRERLRRETAMSMQMFSSVVDIRLPYMDSDFVDVCMRVPPQLKMGGVIQSFILQQRSPAFLNVVNANTGTLLEAGDLRKKLGSTRLKVLSKLGVRGFQPYERMGLWLSHQLQPFVREILLSERALDRGLFDPEMAHRIVDDHRDRRKNHTFLLMAMLIFEIGQRQLVDDDSVALD